MPKAIRKSKSNKSKPSLSQLRTLIKRFVADHYPDAKYVNLTIEHTDRGSPEVSIKIVGDYDAANPRPACLNRGDESDAK